MTLKNLEKDPATLTMVVTAEFTAPVDRVWQLWADPRQLERWWGPPTYPATVVDHELAPGGAVSYYMTSPEGNKHHGWWRVLTVDAPHSLEVEDGFADDRGTPNPGLPTTTMRVALSEEDGITQVVTTSTFPSLEAMEQLLAMGMEEGLREAMSQMDEILAGVAIDLFAGIPVSDYATSLNWYQRLLGSEPSFLPHATEAVWELAEHRYIFIEERPEHAGHAMHTIFVGDLDALVEQIAGRGVEPVERETYGNGVRKMTYRDPDGNEIGYGGAPEG